MLESIDYYLDEHFQSVSESTSATLCPLFNRNLLKELNLSKSDDISSYTSSMSKLLTNKGTSNSLIDQQILNQTFFKFSVLNNEHLNNFEKERFCFLQTLLSTVTENKNSLSHPSYEYIRHLLSSNNLLAGYGMELPSNNGIDSIILDLDKNSKITKLYLGEWKYRFGKRNPFDSLYLSNIIVNYLKSTLKKGKRIGPYLNEEGDILRVDNTGFSFYPSFNRGNDLLLKLLLWDASLNALVNLSHFETDEHPLNKVTHKKSKLRDLIYEALLDLSSLEALCENGLILTADYEVTTERIFTFVSNNKTLSIKLKTSDFDISRGAKRDENGFYYTFNLVNYSNFQDIFPDLNPDYYKIYIAEDNEEFYLEDNLIFSSNEFLDKNSQNLIAEIKTRFVNDIRNNKILYSLKVIMNPSGILRSDLISITAHPRINEDNQNWDINRNLKHTSKNRCLFGVDRVFEFGLVFSYKSSLSTNEPSWYSSIIDKLRDEGAKPRKLYSKKENEAFEDLFAGLDLVKQKQTYIPPDFEYIGKKYPEQLFVLGSKMKKTHVNNLLNKMKVNLQISSPYDSNLVRNWSCLIDSMTSDYSKNSAGKKIENQITPIFVPTSTFNKTDSSEMYVVLINKNGSQKSIVKDDKTNQIERLETKLNLSFSQSDLFPGIREIRRGHKQNFAFILHTTSDKTIDILYKTLLKSPSLKKIGKDLIHSSIRNWKQILNEKGRVDVYLNSFQSCWLLLYTFVNMLNIRDKLYGCYLNEKEKSVSEKSKKRMFAIHPQKILTKREFFQNYSFGLINKASWYNSRRRLVYEIQSKEYTEFFNEILNRLKFLFLWSEQHRWIKPLKTLIRSYQKIIESLE